VMIININSATMRAVFLRYLPIGTVIGLILLVELIVVFGAWAVAPSSQQQVLVPMQPDVTNTEALGPVLYTDYIYLFQAAGLILLVAMIGAIVLTLRQRAGVRRQSIAAQVGRHRADTLEIKDVPSGSGI